MHFRTRGEKVFNVFNYVFITIICLTCALPIIHILAVSFSSPHYVSGGRVSLWPMGFTTEAYNFAFQTGRFVRAFGVSVQRSLLGVAINMFLMITTAYPLAKSVSRFSARNFYMAFFAITMIFGGGLVPFYILLSNMGMLDTIWALVLPGGLPVFSMIILMNFIRNLPEELEEAAMIDGAGYFVTLARILLPVLKPALATVALFSFVFHWNEWFNGMLFMNDPRNYPLQTYLQTLLLNFRDLMRAFGADHVQLITRLNERTGRAAQLFMGMLPVLVVYPFLQKYFTKGLIIGSVKG
ncbi:MAG: carbohydrate ABC transporter permease [Defluviitaleaceae bacterium]|nr:carbohydrate ABC transporter permease [Defluviitaleaceae bacterium]MCL2837442.1 carbohydrate ABC transporter permease [Defluviitaleaceae bacterium]